MVTRAQVIAEARTWIGTRYRHEGRIRGHACDCVGLVLGVAQALGLADVSLTGYGKIPQGVESGCDAHMARAEPPRPGDVLLFRIEDGGEAKHLGLMTDLGVIHAYAAARKVCEHRIDGLWRRRLVRGYALPGVVGS